MKRDRTGGGSLARSILVTAAVHALLLLAAGVGVVIVNAVMRSGLEQATAEYVEEERRADRIAGGVMRQLLTASAFHARPDPELARTFRRLGDEFHDEMRRYLFRDISPEQRLQLELVREQHEYLEVAAARSFELIGRGREDEGRASAEDMINHGLQLHAAVEGFLEMRGADLDRLRARQAATFRYVYAAAAGLGVLLMLSLLLMSHFLYRRIARPLAELGGAAHRVGHGDFDVRVRAPREDEFARVADSFNRMAASLADARRDLERRNVQLKDTLERLRQTQAELVQNEKLSAIGRMMAGLAHELNNPLASVLGFSELLRERLEAGETVDPAELADAFVEPITEEAARARELVHTFLLFARRSSAEIGPVPLRTILDLVVRLRSYALEQAGIALRLGSVPEDLHVRAESQKLQQVLLNVVGNAHDALREGGAISIHAEVDEDAVRLIVDDDGPGLSEPERVFEPFYTTKPVGEGTGLGLALVHRFMSEFGGSVRAVNRIEGGARIVLEFVRAQPPGVEDADHEQPARTLPAALRILVVEDEEPLRRLQQRMLARLHADVLTAASGTEACALLEAHDFDLVISDVRMPDGDGIELYRWINDKRPTLADRFLFVTGDIGDPDIAALAQERPDRFLLKPFHMDDYLDRVANVIA